MDQARARDRMLADFAAQHAAVLAIVRDKWPAFIERVRKHGLAAGYDPVEDTLYLYPGKSPLPASTEPLAENVYVRLDRDTDDIVGLEVLHFRDSMGELKLASTAFHNLNRVPVLPAKATLFFSPDEPDAPVRISDLELLFRSSSP